MKCPGCSHSDWEYPDASIARCTHCGYLLDPYVFGLKRSPSSSNVGRSVASKRLAIIAFTGALLLLVSSRWFSEALQFAIIALGASLILFLDSLMYS